MKELFGKEQKRERDQEQDPRQELEALIFDRSKSRWGWYGSGQEEALTLIDL